MATRQQYFSTFSIGWQKPSSSLVLRPGEAHIWKVRLSHPEAAGRYLTLLSADEYNRAARLVIAEVRNKFISARIALRKILSIYTRQNPGDIWFNYGQLGKPHLSPLFNGQDLQFNLSHSGDFIMAVLTLEKELGVDLERNIPVSGKRHILKLYFGEDDQKSFNQLPEGQQNDAFMNAWTHKEAMGKAYGSGLANPLDADFIHPAAHRSSTWYDAQLRIHPDHWLLRMVPENGYSAAVVCLSCENPKLNFYQTTSNQLLRL